MNGYSGPPSEPGVAPAERERSMVRAFVDLAGGLVGDFDVQDLLHRLAEHCVRLVDSMSACGVMLLDRTNVLSVVAAFPDVGRALDVAQLEVGDGPCLECVRTGRGVHSTDLIEDGARWPRWSRLAVARDFRTVYATPLRLGDQIIGTLNLFGPSPTDSTEQDLLIIRALADVATITILQQRSVSRAAALNTQLQTALASRIAVEQAKGVLSESLGVDMDEAFTILRHNSRSTNTKLTVLAGYLASGRIKAAELQRPGPADQRPGRPPLP